MGRVLPRLALLTFVLTLSHGTHASTEIRYIDDNDATGVVYSPSNQWSYGPTCTTCSTEKYASLDTSQAHGGSWHETTLMKGGVLPALTLTFTGTTIDVFFIVLNLVPNTDTHAAYTFTLDGADGTPYTHVPDSTSNIMYKVPVFSKAGLNNAQHTLVIHPFLQPDTDQTLLLFDYAQYTFGEPAVPISITSQPPSSTSQPFSGSSLSSSSVPSSIVPPSSGLGTLPATSGASPSLPTTSSLVSSSISVVHTRQAGAAAIAGGTIGGIVVIASVFFAFWCIRRRQRHQAGSPLPTRNYEEADQHLQQSLAATHCNPFLDPVADRQVISQQHSSGTHHEPFLNQSVVSSKALAAFRRRVYAQASALPTKDLPSAAVQSADIQAIRSPNMHMHQRTPPSTITEDGSRSSVGGSEIRIPRDELERLRAENSNVQSLQAEIARLRADVAHSEEPPPSYRSEGRTTP